jgi:hypothetical protein
MISYKPARHKADGIRRCEVSPRRVYHALHGLAGHAAHVGNVPKVLPAGDPPSRFCLQRRGHIRSRLPRRHERVRP